MKNIYMLALGLFSLNSFAQVGINTQNPKTDLDISYSDNFVKANGVLTPRLTVEELELFVEKYGQPQNSVLLFITEGIGMTSQTRNIKEAGFYYFNANENVWFRLEREPWFSFENKLPASNNYDDIYQLSSIGIGDDSTVNTTSVLDITSDNKGILLPRLTKEERNNIINPSQGLLIFNTTTKCFNYYVNDSVKWLSLCGEFAPSSFDIACNPAETGLTSPYLNQGTNLNTGDNYQLPIMVENIGSYTILGTTGNGYSFNQEGNFVILGNQTLTIKGQGVPASARQGDNEDVVSFKFNGVQVSPPANCPLKTIEVKPSLISFKVDCDSKAIVGDFNAGTSTNQGYVTYIITEVYNPGIVEIRTNTVNGVYFTTRTVNITADRTQLNFYPVGTPTQILNDVEYTFTLFYNDGLNQIARTCSFEIDFGTNLGTFANPANRCLEIYNLGERTDGECFMKSKSGQPFKTFCDMTNGGYTLIRSTSEKAMLSEPTAAPNSLWKDPSFYSENVIRSFNQAQGQNGTIIYENFQIPLAERKLVRSRQDAQNTYRVRIVEVKANLNNNNDVWANNNYMVFEFDGSKDFISEGFTFGAGTFKDVKTTGKLFGKDYSAPYGYETLTFDGKTINTSVYGGYTTVYNQGIPGNGYPVVGISHGVLGNSGLAAADHQFTYINTNGTTRSTNFRYVDQLFGFYNDSTINHHLGKYTSATADDYQGVQSCISGGFGSNNGTRFPHSFNSGEGRYMQWFVK